jgi:hypothetical protein
MMRKNIHSLIKCIRPLSLSLVLVFTAAFFLTCAPAAAPVAKWEMMDSGTKDYLLAVWGNSNKDVFAVGFSGAIFHYDGKAWVRMESGTDGWFLGIWGSSPSNVIAAGQKGCLLHYDGTGWKPIDSGSSLDLWAAWGTSASDIYVSRQLDGTFWTSRRRTFYVMPGVHRMAKCWS